ncbi:hypothetical protein DPMN_125827 [Dreissena polymorpha]|uniref:RING-type E3 ubiquitin transferase n=1 Tax=Dreissena polymorpha TaxID=45954 RepID=A0A9D4JV23_DREPO|nr:hypothetical protein DPMN_125827 [Dreissena polymorpha]
MQPGVRIIRGPDWNSKRQDGGEGHVGTVIYVPKDGPADGHVSVIWDNGRAYRYRAGQDGKYDLRIVDNTPAGVVQEGITCDVCKMDPIRGIRWKCGVCKDFDLCTPCYMTGKHDTGHSFMRIEHQHKHASPVSPRNGTPTIEIQGVFKGAVVMRGSSWKWKNDDGGNSGSGDVTDVVPWKPDLPRSAVKVAWRQTKKEGIYRLGAEGCVDVVYETCASGGKVYQDHLPLVDVVNPDQIKLRASDKVKVTLDLESFKRLQEHDAYGGWNDKMCQCLSEVGTIVRMLYEGKSVRVQYEDGQAFTMNRQALYRIHSFSVGEAVRILPDVNTVRDLQAGHGGWNDDMLGSLGQVGRVAKIDADGDMRVKVGDRKWIFSPVCVQPLDDPKQSDSVPGLRPDEMEQDKVDDFRRMQRDMDRLAGGTCGPVHAASKGDIEKVKAIVGKDSSKVNVSPGQKNALQLACYNGHIPVVQYLLDQNVDVLAVDDEGDTALHYASYGKEASAMKLLLKKGAQPDKQNNKGLTALHITVGKGNVQGTKLLIKNKASVNLKDKDGDTPMHDCITQIKRQGLLVPAVLKAPGADFTIMNGN